MITPLIAELFQTLSDSFLQSLNTVFVLETFQVKTFAAEGAIGESKKNFQFEPERI